MAVASLIVVTGTALIQSQSCIVRSPCNTLQWFTTGRTVNGECSGDPWLIGALDTKTKMVWNQFFKPQCVVLADNLPVINREQCSLMCAIAVTVDNWVILHIGHNITPPFRLHQRIAPCNKPLPRHR